MKYLIMVFIINFMEIQELSYEFKNERKSRESTLRLNSTMIKPINFQELHRKNIQRKIIERSA